LFDSRFNNLNRHIIINGQFNNSRPLIRHVSSLQKEGIEKKIITNKRPTKEELLSTATGFWQRLGIRFKWFSIRSGRRFNTDDISAFVSWFFLGHIIWIIVGTTTFFSLAIFTINTVFAQETLAKWVGNYLTSSSGVKVVFESAIVPRWKDGVISFHNVFITKRPGNQLNFVKGSSTTAAVEAALKRQSNVPDEDDTNYTQYDLSIDTVNVTLSFTKWFNGKGLLDNVSLKGIRGIIDRSYLNTTDNVIVDPKTFKYEHQAGDFEIESFKLEDLLVTIYQPDNFRPFSVSIYSCELSRLRKRWLFYDLLASNHMSGSIDDSLFTIHPRQQSHHTNSTSGGKKNSILRIDGLKIDHLNRGIVGPFSWIYDGTVDITADIIFPTNDDEKDNLIKVVTDFYNPKTVTANDENDTDQSDELVLDLKLSLNNVHAAVPLFTKDLSYVNNALIRPIVGYINSKKTFIPINCKVVKNVSEFDGSWTIYDSGLMDDLSIKVDIYSCSSIL